MLLRVGQEILSQEIFTRMLLQVKHTGIIGCLRVKMLRAYFIMALLFSALAGTLFFGTVHATSVPEFTLKYVDYSYDVPPKATITTDPYTNETLTTTIPGRHVENKTIEATINNNIGASYYNFRYKGRYENEWRYYPFYPNSSLPYFFADAYSVPYQASTSSYTVAALPSYFFKNIEHGEVDVQVQALFGDFRAEPFGHIGLPAPTYDFYFEGTTSDWSGTQTTTIGGIQTPTPSPATTPTPPPTPYSEVQLTEQEIIIGVAAVAVVIGAGLGFLIYLIKRK
jgi:hypothetical protein